MNGSIKNCSKCGEQIGAEDSFCPFCGTSSVAAKIFCNVCGAVNSLEQSFCENCGSKLVVDNFVSPKKEKPYKLVDVDPFRSVPSGHEENNNASSKKKVIGIVLGVVACLAVLCLGYLYFEGQDTTQAQKHPDTVNEISEQKTEPENAPDPETAQINTPAVETEENDVEEAEVEEPVVEKTELLQYMGTSLANATELDLLAVSYEDYTHTGWTGDRLSMSAIKGQDVVTRIEIWNSEDFVIGGIEVGQTFKDATEKLEREGYALNKEGTEGYYFYDSEDKLRIALKKTNNSPHVVECIYAEDLSQKLDLSYFIGDDIFIFVENLPSFKDGGASSGTMFEDGSADVCTWANSDAISYVGFDYGDCDYSICGVTYGMPFDKAVQVLDSRGFTQNTTDVYRYTFSNTAGLTLSIYSLSDIDKKVDSCSLMKEEPLPQLFVPQSVVQYQPVVEEPHVEQIDVKEENEADISDAWQDDNYVYVNPEPDAPETNQDNDVPSSPDIDTDNLAPNIGMIWDVNGEKHVIDKDGNYMGTYDEVIGNE